MHCPSTQASFDLHQIINIAIGMPMCPRNGKPTIDGAQIYGGSLSGETAVLVEATVGEKVTLGVFLECGQDIINNGGASSATLKALGSMELMFIVLPNISDGFPLGRVVKTNVFSNRNTENNDPVTSVVLGDRKELDKIKNYLGSVELPNETEAFYMAMKMASDTIGASHSQMFKTLRAKRQGCAIKPKKRAAPAAPADRGNGRALRALSVRPVYAEDQDDDTDLLASAVGSTSAIIEACSFNHPSGRHFKNHGPIKLVGPVGYMNPLAAFGELVVAACCF